MSSTATSIRPKRIPRRININLSNVHRICSMRSPVLPIFFYIKFSGFFIDSLNHICNKFQSLFFAFGNTEKSTNSTDFKDVSTADSCRSTNEASDLTEETVASERDTDLEYARTKIGHLFYRLGIFFRNLWNRLSRLWQKICRIPSSVENFTLTIQNICAKIESYQKFLEHPRTKAAFSLIKDKFFRLLRHVFPTRIQGTLTFGSSDPSVTGAVLAILGMTIPLHKNCIAVTPLFEDRNVILGNIQIKGRIYGVVLLKTALELYFNKNIKYIIRRWKHK